MLFLLILVVIAAAVYILYSSGKDEDLTDAPIEEEHYKFPDKGDEKQ